MPTQDWLTQLSEQLKAEVVQEKPTGWALTAEIASSLNVDYQAAAGLAKRKVKAGQWETQRMKIRLNGVARLVNLYRPKQPTNATGARRSR